jgi:hypothetical protein
MVNPGLSSLGHFGPQIGRMSGGENSPSFREIWPNKQLQKSCLRATQQILNQQFP